MESLVSVIIPAYNQDKFIAEAIESVLRQDYSQEQIEIIVVDDGSTDGTREICMGHGAWGMGHGVKDFASSLKPQASSLKYVHQSNSGKAIAVKAGIGAASGKYIFNLDADDMFLPDKIRKVVDVFESDSEITYVAHPVIYWDEEKNTKKTEQFPEFMRAKKVYGKELIRYFYRINRFIGCGSSFAARADILKKIPISKREINYAVDAYLVLFSANAGYSYFMDEPLSLYRVHASAYSLKDQQKRVEIDMLANQAILSEIKNLSFDEEIKALQTLKTKISQLKFREFSRSKTTTDIKDLWAYIIDNRKIFAKDIFSIIKNYRILQRSLPMRIVNLSRKPLTENRLSRWHLL